MEENRKYNIIYADPPWQYRVWKKKEAGRTAQSHYPTMDIPALSSLPISNLAAPDCALFLWVTFPLLFESYQLLQTWGFEYKTVAFVWVKLNRKSDSLLKIRKHSLATMKLRKNISRFTFAIPVKTGND